MDELLALRLAVVAAHEVAAEDLDEHALVEGLHRIFRADAGVGFTVWRPAEEAGPGLVSAGCDPWPVEKLIRAAPFAATHPGFAAMRRVGTSESVLLSREVPLRPFWETESWDAMHGHTGGRFPASALLYADAHLIVFMGMHRRARDFAEEEMALFSRMQQPIAAAYRYRAAVDHAAERVEMLFDGRDDETARTRRDPEAPTRREAEVVGLMAAGWTNVQIAQRLRISERTVRKHLSAVYERAHLPGRAAAATWWMRHRDDFVDY